MKKAIRITRYTTNLFLSAIDKIRYVDKFALQLEDAPVYITYALRRDCISVITVEDVVSKKSKVIKVNLDNSILNFLIILNEIRSAYKQGILFTDKSEIN